MSGAPQVALRNAMGDVSRHRTEADKVQDWLTACASGMQYWISFANKLNPNPSSNSYVYWPAYSTSNPTSISLAVNNSVLIPVRLFMVLPGRDASS